MARNTYVTNGYSNYTNIPAQRDGYADFIGSPSVVDPSKEYGHTQTMSGGPRYTNKSHYDDYESNYRVNYENSSPPLSPNRYTHGYFSNESNRVKLRTETGSTCGPNKSWQTVDSQTTHHPRTTSTNNNINEALGTLEDYLYNSPGGHQRQGGVPDYPSQYTQRFAQPLEFRSEHDERNASVPEPIESGKGYAQSHAFVPKDNYYYYYKPAYLHSYIVSDMPKRIDNRHKFTKKGRDNESHEDARRYSVNTVRHKIVNQGENQNLSSARSQAKSGWLSWFGFGF